MGARKGGFASALARRLGGAAKCSGGNCAIAASCRRSRLRLHGTIFEGIVEEAIYQAAPDLTALTIEGAEEKQGFVPLEMLQTTMPVLNGVAKEECERDAGNRFF